MREEKVFLVAIGNPQEGYTLDVVQSLNESIVGKRQGSVRVSPIFRVIASPGNCHVREGTYIGLLSPLSAFEFIGKQPKEVREHMWFSLGIASVLIFSDNKSVIEKLCDDYKDELAAWEIWHIGSERVLNVEKIHVSRKPMAEAGLKSYQGLSPDSQRLLDEIRLHLHEALYTAATFMPEQVSKLQVIVKSVNEIADEIYYLEAPESREPPPEFNRGGGTPSPSERNQRLNQGLSHLIQLNSALAYAVSQTSYGTAPILERPCLASAHSLLGIGTAYRAVAAISGFAERVFEGTPVLAVIDERYRSMPGIPIERNVPDYQVKLWNNADKFNIESQLKGVASEEIRPKLAFFSSRLGFGEAHFSVTAATQVLHAADSVRWTLATLTHELLHSHVRGLLATILSEKSREGLNTSTFKDFHGQFLAWMRSDQHPATLIDCIRFVIFSFASGRHSALDILKKKAVRSTSDGQTKLEHRVPTGDELFSQFFRSSLHLLEEIFVHTLDLHYFYNGNRDLFLEVLWESWTTVPAVVSDLEHYLLRSIVACASIDRSPARTLEQRRDESISLLRQKLKDLGDITPKNLFLHEALSCLNKSDTLKRIRLLFTPSIYLADMVATLLFSSSIQSKFWTGDRKIDSKDGASTYLMDTLEFTGGSVSNPVAFLMDRVLRQRTEQFTFDEEYRSAWVLLATASASRPLNSLYQT